MRKTSIFLLLIALVSVGSLFAQNLIVRGIVVDDETGEPLIGASVVVIGTQQGTITDLDGKFSVNATNNANLEISYVGYINQQVKASSSQMRIRLASDSRLLEEVVAIGYGTMKSKDLTSSITTIKAADLIKTQSGQAMQALQGKVPGLQVVSSGNPGDQPKIRVRGVGSYPGIGNENPLYVVDGMFFDNIDFLNPTDIASISVLKDASASAIYGVRAANGVVLIETKSGIIGSKEQKFEVNYNGYYGIQRAQNILKMANSEQYATMAMETGDIKDENFINSAMQRYGRSRINANVPNVNTDWYNEIIRDAAIQNHSLDVSGGNAKANYTVGLNYFNQDGILKMKNAYDRFNLRTKVDYQATDFMKVGANFIFSDGTKNNQASSAWNMAYFAVPILPVYDELNVDASPTKYSNAKFLGYRGSQNPFPSMDFTDSRMLIRKLITNFYVNLDIIPKKLSFKTSFNHAFTSLYERNVYFPYDLGLDVHRLESQVTKVQQSYSDKIWDNVLTYNDKFDQHSISVMLGSSYRNNSFDRLSGTGIGFETEYPQSWYISQSTTKPSDGISDDGFRQYGLSYFGRATYNFANRYLVYGTLRADGSSKYQEKWGIFPSVGAGWVVSEESFWDGVTGVDFLKLRASWGQLGNENVPASDGATTTFVANTVFNGVKYSGTKTTSTFSSLKWEMTEESNFGLTANFLGNKLSLDADFFTRDTKNAVISVLLPAVGGSVKKNGGVIRNSGLEFALGWNDKISDDFSYNISANISTLKNEVMDLYGQQYIDGGSAEFRQRSALGQPILSFYGREVIGVYQNDAEIAADSIAINNGLVPGDFKYKDQNGDGEINDDDRTFLGSYFPTFMYGGNIGINYKSFEFSANLMGQSGNKILNRKRGELIWTNDGNMDADLAINRWHGDGTSNKYPSASGLRRGWNQKMSTYFVEDGSFFRIQNIQLAYNIPVMKSMKIQQAKILFTADRPITVFKYNGFSPEVENGIDTQTYPIPAVYTIGLNVKF